MTISTLAAVKVTAVLPCLMCAETQLTVLATPPTQSNVAPSPIPPRRLGRREGTKRRQALTNWGNVTMYGFKAKIDLPDGYSYCGPMGNVTKVNVDVGSGNNTLQTAANQCVSYYYSNIGMSIT